MTKFMFADRYAEAALAPTPQIVASREAPAARIVESITPEQIFALVSVYYGDSNSTLGWFRDEFIKDDASFSLVNNERDAGTCRGRTRLARCRRRHHRNTSNRYRQRIGTPPARFE